MIPFGLLLPPVDIRVPISDHHHHHHLARYIIRNSAGHVAPFWGQAVFLNFTQQLAPPQRDLGYIAMSMASTCGTPRTHLHHRTKPNQTDPIRSHPILFHPISIASHRSFWFAHSTGRGSITDNNVPLSNCKNQLPISETSDMSA